MLGWRAGLVMRGADDALERSLYSAYSCTVVWLARLHAPFIWTQPHWAACVKASPAIPLASLPSPSSPSLLPACLLAVGRGLGEQAGPCRRAALQCVGGAQGRIQVLGAWSTVPAGVSAAAPCCCVLLGLGLRHTAAVRCWAGLAPCCCSLLGWAWGGAVGWWRGAAWACGRSWLLLLPARVQAGACTLLRLPSCCSIELSVPHLPAIPASGQSAHPQLHVCFVFFSCSRAAARVDPLARVVVDLVPSSSDKGEKKGTIVFAVGGGTAVLGWKQHEAPHPQGMRQSMRQQQFCPACFLVHHMYYYVPLCVCKGCVASMPAWVRSLLFVCLCMHQL